jgi:transcriptional/translational regulatory protein YebC/TACO1
MLPTVKPVLAILFWLALLLLPGAAGEKVVLYARMKETTEVDLTTGAKWRMDKGDSFPIIAYKESHTKVILQLAGAQFMVNADRVETVPKNDVPAAVENYRENVTQYINSFSDRWKKNAQQSKPSS